MRQRILSLVVAFVLWSPALLAQAAPAEPDGAALYRQHCRSCHGLKGTPPARMVTVYPTLKAIDQLSADSIVTVLRRGKGKDMKAFADRLSAAEMQAVAAYVRTFATP